MILQKPNTTPFDPANKAHRHAVAAFLKRNAWADSPIRFSYDPTYGSVSDQVRAKMLTWYMDKEMIKIPKSASAVKKIASLRPLYKVS